MPYNKTATFGAGLEGKVMASSYECVHSLGHRFRVAVGQALDRLGVFRICFSAREISRGAEADEAVHRAAFHSHALRDHRVIERAKVVLSIHRVLTGHG